MSDKIIYRRPIPGLLSVSGDQDTSRGEQFPLYEGLVVDVILDHTHPSYSRVNGSNVGSIKVRILEVNQMLDDEGLPWADPLDFSFFEMPLIGEMVVLYKLRGNFFYKNKISFAKKLPENAFLNLNSKLSNRPNKKLRNVILNSSELQPDIHKFGNYWRPDFRVRQLKHFEGDILLQGRMGHSIRFGSSKIDPSSKGLAPNIILRAGQGKDIENDAISIDSEFGLIVEDINKDASSIWIVSDQNIPFEPTTINAGSFYRSIENPINVFGGASITNNSDRLILNSKKTHIMMFSNEEIYLNSFKRTSIDTDNSIMLTANIDIIGKASGNIEYTADKDYNINAGGDYKSITIGTTSFLSNKIFIGSASDEKEPIVGGTSLSIFLARLITALMGIPTNIRTQTQRNSRINISRQISPAIAASAHVITPVGPGALNPTIVAALQTLYRELASGQFTQSPFNSEDNFVNLQNEQPVVELNDFETGEQVVTENNEWKLSESYYKVV
jgi:hypothetical protein